MWYKCDLEFRKPKQEVNKLFNRSIVAMAMRESGRKRHGDGESLRSHACSRKENLIIFSLLCFLA